MAAVGGASGGGASKAGGASKGSAAGRAGKTGTQSGKAAKSSAKAKASANSKAAQSKKAAQSAQVKKSMASDRVADTKSEQKARDAVKADSNSQAEKQSREAARNTALDAVTATQDKAKVVNAAGKISEGLGGKNPLGNAAGAVANGIDTVDHAGKAIEAANKGDFNKALNETGQAAVSGVKTAADVAQAVAPFAKIGSRFLGPAGIAAAAVDNANFANSLNKAYNEGGAANWGQAAFDGVKAGLSDASLVPGVGAVPGALAGAMDLGQMGYNYFSQ